VRPIVFISDRTGNPEVWRRNPDGSNEVQLTASPEPETEPRLSPDGTQILFGRQVSPDPRFPQARLWLMNVDGTNQHDVSPPPPPTTSPAPPGVSWDRNGIWSPDGTQIAFIREGNPSGIFIMNSDGTNASVEIPEPEVERLSSLTWSPDGTRFAYVYLYHCCLEHIQIHHLNGSGDHALIGPLNGADTETFSDSPVWSADSAQITFFGKLSFNGPTGRWIANAEGPPNPVPVP